MAEAKEVAGPDELPFGGICYPGEKGQRLPLSDLVTFAISKGISSGAVKVVPPTIYLVGHFTRADIPAFADFKTLTEMMSAVRNTFLSFGSAVAINYGFPDGEPVAVKVEQPPRSSQDRGRSHCT